MTMPELPQVTDEMLAQEERDAHGKLALLRAEHETFEGPVLASAKSNLAILAIVAELRRLRRLRKAMAMLDALEHGVHLLQAQALRDAAEAWPKSGDIVHGEYVERWLLERADEIEGKTS